MDPFNGGGDGNAGNGWYAPDDYHRGDGGGGNGSQSHSQLAPFLAHSQAFGDANEMDRLASALLECDESRNQILAALQDTEEKKHFGITIP